MPKKNNPGCTCCGETCGTCDDEGTPVTLSKWRFTISGCPDEWLTHIEYEPFPSPRNNDDCNPDDTVEFIQALWRGYSGVNGVYDVVPTDTDISVPCSKQIFHNHTNREQRWWFGGAGRGAGVCPTAGTADAECDVAALEVIALYGGEYAIIGKIGTFNFSGTCAEETQTINVDYTTGSDSGCDGGSSFTVTVKMEGILV